MMLDSLKRLVERLRPGSLERGDFSRASKRPVENIEAGAAANMREDEVSGVNVGGNYPPGYVKPHDEGRPRH